MAAQAAPRHGDLQLEVVGIRGLSCSDYRVGDIAGGLLGIRKLRPYVRAAPPEGLLAPDGAGSSWRTHAADADVDGCAEFCERGAFPLLDDFGPWLVGLSFRIQVYDQRGVQALLRGDPLIGEGVLQLTEAVLGSAPDLMVPIKSKRGEPRGMVTLRAGLRAPSAVAGVLRESRGSPLAKVAAALAQVLAQPSGADALLATRPDVLKMLPPSAEEQVRRTLRGWVVRFCRRVGELRGDECDREAILHLAQLARSAQDLVAMCVWWDDDAADVQSLAVAWIQRLLAACAGDAELHVELDEARLRRLLGAHGSAEGDPRLGLQELGASALPDPLRQEVALALWLRVSEAQRGGEEELFTGEPLVQQGRLVPGVAAVMRPAPKGGPPHVFLYHGASIRQWQAKEHTDPCTRGALQERDILQLS